MEKYYYELLKFIQDAPDAYISKEVIYNCLHWNYNKIDAVIIDLLENKCIDTFNINGVDKYKVNFKGQVFIKNFKKTIFSKKSKNLKSDSDKLSSFKNFMSIIVTGLKSLLSILKDLLPFVPKK